MLLVGANSLMKYELRFNDDQIKKSLHASVKRHIRNTVQSNIKSLEAKVKERYAINVKKTKEYTNITSSSSTFRTELGVPNSPEVLESIIEALLDNVEVRINRIANDESAYIFPITITLFDEKIMKNILAVPGASYYSESAKRGTLTEVPWLSWLLLSGNEPVVYGFRVMYNKELWSRTEDAIMVPATNEKPNNYSIPEQFSGTRSDNFLTRAALNTVEELPLIIQKEIIGKL
jgi:hypothetical protein